MTAHSLRITRLPIFFALSLLLVACRSVPADNVPPGAPSPLTLTLLHDNDLHGHMLPFAYTEVGKSPLEQPSRGGAARRATLIRQLRKQIKNPTFLLDSGDTFTRGPLTNAYEGIADIEAMNAVGYELCAVGNNEFKAKDGVDQNDAAGAQAALLLDIKRSRFPWICANVTDEKGAFLEGIQPYIVREFQGVRVGFLGLTTPKAITYPQTKGWTVTDPITAALKWIPIARAHCDILIAVTHDGVPLDEMLAAQTSGLDAIVGGDSHTFLYKAEEVANTDGVKVPIVQAGEFGVDLGRFDLHLARDRQGHWHLASYQYVLLPITPSLAEAPDVKAVIAPYVRPYLNVVGHLPSIAATPAARNQQTTQILVDAMRQQTGADLALNGNGDGFFNVFRHTAVTRYDLYAAMPFHDNVIVASLTGTEVQALIKSHPKTVALGDISHMDMDKTYKVAMVDYEASSTYKIPASKIQETGRDERLVVIAYLQQETRGPQTPDSVSKRTSLRDRRIGTYPASFLGTLP